MVHTIECRWNYVRLDIQWKLCAMELMKVLSQFTSACTYSEFTFSLFVLPGSNSSDWLRSVNGGDDF